MLKNISKSSVNRRRFPVYKEWEVSNTQYPVISASLEDGFFDTASFNQQDGLFTHPLLKSIHSKYYNQNANPFTIFGRYDDLSNIKNERKIVDGNYYIINLPQDKYGEEIKPGSVELSDLDNDVVYSDNFDSAIVADVPLYDLVSIDIQSEEIIILDNDSQQFSGTITSIDFQTGITVLTFGSDTDSIFVSRIDFENTTIQFAEPLDFDGLDIDELQYGNIFYDEGLFIFHSLTQFSNYTLKYRSTKTIHETEVLISAKSGEFNYSQNPSAVDVLLSGSYDFTTTPVTNSLPGGVVKIKEVLDISRKSTYSGSYDTSVSGSWNDYFDNKLSDPTGSYISPFISTIGLYDDDGDMIAVAKLPNPIKNLPDYNMNFIVRFDT